jgi:hypothetical protein
MHRTPKGLGERSTLEGSRISIKNARSLGAFECQWLNVVVGWPERAFRLRVVKEKVMRIALARTHDTPPCNEVSFPERGSSERLELSQRSRNPCVSGEGPLWGIAAAKAVVE